MKIKVSEATPVQIDWLVAKCEGAHPQISYPDKRLFGAIGDTFDYSTDWSQGGPIIERECIDVMFEGPEWYAYMRYEAADGYNRTLQYDGPTPLIAACRCYVASKLGKKVEVPDDLL